MLSLFVTGVSVCLRMLMLLFTGGSFGTLWRTDKKLIIKTEASETLVERCPNPGQILVTLSEIRQNGSGDKYLSSEVKVRHHLLSAVGRMF